MKVLAGKWRTADAADIRAVEIVTAANQSSILAKAGWGLVGGALLGPIGALAGLLGGGAKSIHIVSVRSQENEALLQVSFSEYKALLKQVGDGEARRTNEQVHRDQAYVRSSRATVAYHAKLDRLEQDLAEKRITSAEYELRLTEARSALREERV